MNRCLGKRNELVEWTDAIIPLCQASPTDNVHFFLLHSRWQQPTHLTEGTVWVLISCIWMTCLHYPTNKQNTDVANILTHSRLQSCTFVWCLSIDSPAERSEQSFDIWSCWSNDAGHSIVTYLGQKHGCCKNTFSSTYHEIWRLSLLVW